MNLLIILGSFLGAFIGGMLGVRIFLSVVPHSEDSTPFIPKPIKLHKQKNRIVGNNELREYLIEKEQREEYGRKSKKI